MKSAWRSHQPLIGAIVLLLLVTSVTYLLALGQTGGVYVFPLDDPYIHLAIARNVCLHGVWGPTPAEFSSAASSLAWPLQLAGLMALFGAVEWLPLMLNVVYAMMGLAIADGILRGARVAGWWRFGLLCLLVLATTLPLLVLLGMEHTMQTTVNTLFVWWAARALTRDGNRWWSSVVLGVLAALVTATRYEGMFLLVAVLPVALVLRRWLEAGAVVVMGALPLVIFGVYAVAHGSHWLPNSVLVKSDVARTTALGDLIWLVLTVKLSTFIGLAAVYMPLLLALLAVFLDHVGPRRLRPQDSVFVFLVVMTGILHLFGARPGWFTRYEAYLVFLALLAVGVSWRPWLEKFTWEQLRPARRESWPALLCLLLLGFVLAGPLVHRLCIGLGNVPLACKNIHDQQIQMARFVKTYHDDQAVIINDLGAIVWYTEARPLDMAGLATREITKAIFERRYTSTLLNRLARRRQANIAIVYNGPGWLPKPNPPIGWIHVGAWKIAHNVVCGEDTVHFYALNAATADLLQQQLQTFAESLPQDVQQTGRYVEASTEPNS